MKHVYAMGAAILTVAVLLLGGTWLLQTLVAYGAAHIPPGVLRQARHLAPLITFFPAVFVPFAAAMSQRRKAAPEQPQWLTPLPPRSQRPL